MGQAFYTCKYIEHQSTCYGTHKEICTHPKRTTLDGKIVKTIRNIFGTSNSCIAIPGYDRNCPLYEIPEPPSPSSIKKMIVSLQKNSDVDITETIENCIDREEIKILSISLDPNKKWNIKSGQNYFSAVMEDKEFAEKIISDGINSMNGPLFMADVKRSIKFNGSSVITEYSIVKVYD